MHTAIGENPAVFDGRRCLFGGLAMTLRTGHGNGAGVPRIEVLPADELPAGVPASSGPTIERDNAGRVRTSAAAREMGKRGGLAAAESRALGRLLGLHVFDEADAYAPYSRLAREWRDDHMRDLAAHVGGGQVGAGVASIVSTAALQLAASRFMHDTGARTGDAKMLLDASKLADSSRQNLLAAHELAAREAQARGKRARNPVHASILGAADASQGADE